MAVLANIDVPDLEAAIAFYRDGLGLPEIGRFEGHEGYDGVFLEIPGTGAHLELTEVGAELLNQGRRLLADLERAVTRVRMTARGEAGLIRIGVAHLAEPLVAPALAAFQADHPSVVVDRSAMVSERLLEQLAEGRLHAVIIHRVPTFPTIEAATSVPRWIFVASQNLWFARRLPRVSPPVSPVTMAMSAPIETKARATLDWKEPTVLATTTHPATL